MATKRISKSRRVEEQESISNPINQDTQKLETGNSKKIWIGVGIAIVIVVAFWYKTNSWPVVGLVGMRPITRFEVAQMMMKQNGKAAMDEIVVEELVKNELSKNKISVSDAELNDKIAEIRKSLGTQSTLEDVLSSRSTSMDDFKRQMTLQMGVEKLLAGKIQVSSDEVKKYMDDNKGYMQASGEAAQQTEAMQAVKLNKLQSEITTWITDLKNKSKVWRIL
jgi:hypothetical protein